MTEIATQLVTLGRSDEGFPTVNPPVYRTSTILFPTVEALEDATAGHGLYPAYARYGSPTAQHLQDALSTLTEADATYITSSGLSAITTALLGILKAGDHLLMVDSSYGPTRTFCDQVLRGLGIETTYYPSDAGAAEMEPLWRPNTRAMFLESPGSLTFEMQDIGAIAQAAKARGVTVLADTTWVTPLRFKPFDFGIDIALHSLTKYVSGHSDLLMGAISCTKEYRERMHRAWLHLGAHASNDDCYLALRGLRTIAVRLKQHEQAALEMAEWFEQRSEVKRVMHPGLPSDPGHARFKAHFTGSSGLFALELQPVAKAAVAAMLDHLELFGMGYSWGGYESLVIPFYPAASRTTKTWPKDTACLRFHIGLEDTGDLKRDLEAGFERLRSFR